jgi:predicted NBD/HSP70 family sugar kinase
MAESPGSLSGLRLANQDRVVAALRGHGSQAQAGLVRLTGLSPATVSSIVRDLDRAGVVAIGPGVSGGRRANMVSLRTETGVLVGASVERATMRVVVGDAQARLVADEVHILDQRPTSPRYLDAIGEVILDAVARAGMAGQIMRVGLSLSDAGSASLAREGVGQSDGGVAAELSQRLSAVVTIGRPARLELIGELAVGAAQGRRDVVYLTTDPIDAAVLVDGRMLHGADGTAGAIRHLNLREGGPTCSCGNQGCLEAYVGAEALAQQLRPAHGERLSLRRIVEFAAAGDVPSRRVVADAGRHLGHAAAALCNIFNPELVLVNGQLAALEELFLNPVRESAARYFATTMTKIPALMRGSLGERAVAVGALHSVRQTPSLFKV